MEGDPADKEQLVKSAVWTDFILSAEIIVISLDEVADERRLSRALILVVVAVAITAAKLGTGVVHVMPIVLSVLSKVGIAARCGLAGTSCW